MKNKSGRQNSRGRMHPACFQVRQVMPPHIHDNWFGKNKCNIPFASNTSRNNKLAAAC